MDRSTLHFVPLVFTHFSTCSPPCSRSENAKHTYPLTTCHDLVMPMSNMSQQHDRMYSYNSSPDSIYKDQFADFSMSRSTAPPHSRDRGVLPSVRRGLCRIFGLSSQRKTRHGNNSTDSFAYADSEGDDDVEAEMMDDENLAWGKPHRSSKPKSKSKHARRTDEKIRPQTQRVVAEMIDDDNLAWGRTDHSSRPKSKPWQSSEEKLRHQSRRYSSPHPQSRRLCC